MIIMPPPPRKLKFVGEPICKNPGPRLAAAFVDTQKFEYSKVRPPPPLICKQEGLPAFKTEKDLKMFEESVCGNAAVKWLCGFCEFWHAAFFPGEVTGGTSGKSLRKDVFKSSAFYKHCCKEAGAKP